MKYSSVNSFVESTWKVIDKSVPILQIYISVGKKLTFQSRLIDAQCQQL
jgi:type VI protein secretion system component Hcp